MLKRFLAVLATATLAIGLALGAALPASAHTGDLPVTAVCNPATGKYDLTAKLNITQAGTKSGVASWRVGTSTFQGTPTSASGMTNTINITGDGTYVLTTFSLPGTTTGYGPWVYAHTTFSDGFKLGSDGQLKTALTGNCAASLSVGTPPSATPPTCTTDGTLVIPTQPNIIFSGGTDGAGPGTYTVTAKAAPGYTLTGTSSWVIVVKGKSEAPKCAESVKPTVTAATCDAQGKVQRATITITKNDNLRYTIDSVVLAQGTPLPYKAGTYTVKVEALNGYTNTGPSEYTVTIAAFDCNAAQAPTVKQAQCAAGATTPTSATITITTATPGLDYFLDAGTTPLATGTPIAVGPGAHKVTVVAKDGYQNTGESEFAFTVDQITCVPAVKPAIQQAFCKADAFQTGYITITTPLSGLNYSIAGQNGNLPFAAGQVVNLPAGSYRVIVTPSAGVVNSGAPYFDITIADLTCSTAVEPAIAVAECDASGALQSATVTIVGKPSGLVYTSPTINNGAPLASDTPYAVGPGTHSVTVTTGPGVTNTGASSFTLTVAALGCEKAVEPTLTIAECAKDGSVTSAYLVASDATEHLTYTIRGGAVLDAGQPTDVEPGTYVIDVTAADGWTNTGEKSFTIVVDEFGCDKSEEPVLTQGECNPLTGPSQGYIVIPSTTPHLIYTVGGKDYPSSTAGGTQVFLPEGPYTVTVTAEKGWENTGKSSFDGVVEPVDCVAVEYVEPTIVPESCNTELGGTTTGSLAFKLDDDLAYYLDGVLVTSQTPIPASNGIHTITVVPSAGHFVKNGADTFTVEVPEAVGCDNVYTTPLDPYADPEQCDPLSDDAAKVDGTITVVHLEGIQWYIGTKADGSDKVAVGTPQTVGEVKYSYPAGDYFVFAESKDAAISIKPGHEVWPLSVEVPNPECLPTLGLLEADATAAPATCPEFGNSTGTITILPTPGVAYSIEGGQALTSTTTRVAPGTYTVLATATVANSTLTADRFVVTVAAASVLCELTTLAFTGQDTTPFMAIAIILLQAGLALVAVQFLRTRRRARHLAD